MCGICGQIRAGAGPDPAGLRRMVDALAHRGPDDRGVYTRGTAGLGHTRLSIIDLRQGHQPVTNERRDVWAILNGEIYNYRVLREELVKKGHRFATQSDTEVLVHLYEELGVECVHRLRGMFAFAIWDERRQRLFAARDRLGQKPLYFAERPGELAFASEIKALLALDPSLNELDPEALDEYLALRVILPPRSMFRRVRKLPPAHRMTYEPGQRPRIERYWDLAYEPKLAGSDEDLTDELEERIVESLRAHVVADVPVGAFLSGGLDSGLVVALLASRVVDEPLRTFSGSLRYAAYDEAPYARQVAERYGTRHYEQPVTPDLTSLLPRLVAQLDEPSDPLCVCSYLIAQMAARHVKVVLGGDGGDELFGGYDRYYGNRVAGALTLLPERLRRHVTGPLLDRIPDGAWYKSFAHQLKWLHRLSFLEGGSRYGASLGYFYFSRDQRARLYHPDLWARLAGSEPTDAVAHAYARARAEHPIDRMLHADLQLRLPDHAVMILDRMTMAHGLEARSPFLDHELMEFSARLPMRLKVRGRSLRWVEKRLADRHLPADVVRRPKQGFSVALPYMLRQQYERLFTALLSDSRLAQDKLLQQASIDALVAQHRHARVDHGNRLWLLTNAEVWYRMYMRGDSPDALTRAIASTRSPRSGPRSVHP